MLESLRYYHWWLDCVFVLDEGPSLLDGLTGQFIVWLLVAGTMCVWGFSHVSQVVFHYRSHRMEKRSINGKVDVNAMWSFIMEVTQTRVYRVQLSSLNHSGTPLSSDTLACDSLCLNHGYFICHRVLFSFWDSVSV